jgi:glyoxylase-like metal-dependent hydrolase (beta-lactamase superfamily II)
MLSARLAVWLLLSTSLIAAVPLTRNGKTLSFYGGTGEMVLFTHARRELLATYRRGATVYPAAEAELITQPQKFWAAWTKQMTHDYAVVDTARVPRQALPRGLGVSEGDIVPWQDLRFRVLATPGYTSGAVTYIADVDGKRIAWTGDLILSDGRLPDLYSFQAPIPQLNIRGYHGYAARTAQLVESLRRLAAEKPDQLVPSHGPVINEPIPAITRLLRRLEDHWRAYARTDALRWYWGDETLLRRAEHLLRPDQLSWMPMAETRPAPAWLHVYANTRLIVSRDGPSFLVDVGFPHNYDKVAARKPVEGIFVTHYHDDHTDLIARAATEFAAPVYCMAQTQEIYLRPAAFRMPAATHSPIAKCRAMKEGETLQWREFRFTFHHFPGQTIYHSAMLVEKEGEDPVFLVGDSFTPSGLDDYCLTNRNLLHANEGYHYCLRLLRQRAQQPWLVNMHVAPLFRFTPAQLNEMDQALRERTAALRELTMHDDANYAVDHAWAALFPYYQQAKAARPLQLELRVMNHSPVARRYNVGLQLPKGWRAAPALLQLEPGQSGKAHFRVSGARAGLHVITASLRSAGMELTEWTEALVEVR